MSATDPFRGYPDSPIASGRRLRQVNADGNELLNVPKALYVTVTGNLHFDPVNGYEDAAGAAIVAGITLAVTQGQIIDWIRVKKVYADSTATVLAVL